MKRTESKDTIQAPNSTTVLTISRRGFLIGGAATFVGLADISQHASASTTPIGVSDDSISVGYWVGSDSIVVSDISGAASAPDAVIPASSLSPNSEMLQSRGATVRVHGLFGAPLGTAAHRLDVIAQYSLPVPASDAPVFVWSYRTAPIKQSSSSAMFAMPMNPTQGITLSFELTTASGSNGGSQSTAQFSAQSTGVYFIALNPKASPAWSSYVFVANPAAGGARNLFQHNSNELKSLSFPYLMISVAPIGVKTPITY